MGTKAKIDTDLEKLEKYGNEVKLQITALLNGKEVTESLTKAWDECKKLIEEPAKEILEAALKEGLNKDATVEDSANILASSERFLKIRQAIKICSSSGEEYWMWKLQPGEKPPEIGKPA